MPQTAVIRRLEAVYVSLTFGGGPVGSRKRPPAHQCPCRRTTDVFSGV